MYNGMSEGMSLCMYNGMSECMIVTIFASLYIQAVPPSSSNAQL